MIVQEFGKDEPMSLLLPLVQSWRDKLHPEQFSMEIVVSEAMKDIESTARMPQSRVFVIDDNGVLVGFMGVVVQKNPLNYDLLASEHYWYVEPPYRGLSLRLLRNVKRWAKSMGCSHLLLNSMALSGDKANFFLVSRLYEKMGLPLLGKSYLMKL